MCFFWERLVFLVERGWRKEGKMGMRKERGDGSGDRWRGEGWEGE